MAKSSSNKGSLSDAIEKLEKVSRSKSEDVKEILENDYEELLKAVESLKPHLENLRDQVENEARKAKDNIEDQMAQNPWATLGVVGFVAFIIGWLFGRSK